jgi:hypothetical protein
MSVRAVHAYIQVPGRPNVKYITCDKEEFFDYREAVTHDNKFHEKQNPTVVYEQIWSIQEAINKASETGKVVRFLSDKTNQELKQGIVDMKGCTIRKPEKDSNDVAVIPPGIKDFDFFAVDTSLEVNSNGR